MVPYSAKVPLPHNKHIATSQKLFEKHGSSKQNTYWQTGENWEAMWVTGQLGDLTQFVNQSVVSETCHKFGLCLLLIDF